MRLYSTRRVASSIPIKGGLVIRRLHKLIAQVLIISILVSNLIIFPTPALAINRSTVMSRAQQWVDQGTPYSQRAYKDGYRTDCSGYVSMAWSTGISYTTSTLRNIAYPISKEALKPGDMLLNPGSHATLFGGWADASHSKYWAYEETPPKTVKHIIPYPYWPGYGTYTPYRYGGIQDDPTYGTLTVNTSPINAPVSVDGSAWTSAPKAYQVGGGSHTVAFAPVGGYASPASQTIYVGAGESKTVTGQYTALSSNAGKTIDLDSFRAAYSADAGRALVASRNTAAPIAFSVKPNEPIVGNIQVYRNFTEPVGELKFRWRQNWDNAFFFLQVQADGKTIKTISRYGPYVEDVVLTGLNAKRITFIMGTSRTGQIPWAGWFGQVSDLEFKQGDWRNSISNDEAGAVTDVLGRDHFFVAVKNSANVGGRTTIAQNFDYSVSEVSFHHSQNSDNSWFSLQLLADGQIIKSFDYAGIKSETVTVNGLNARTLSFAVIAKKTGVLVSPGWFFDINNIKVSRLINPSFEEWESTDQPHGWSISSNTSDAIISKSTSSTSSGAYSLEAVNNATDTARIVAVSQVVDVNAGQRYTFSAHAHADRDPASIQAAVDYLDLDNQLISRFTQSGFRFRSSPDLMYVEGGAPAGAVKARLSLSVGGTQSIDGGPGGAVIFDDASFRSAFVYRVLTPGLEVIQAGSDLKLSWPSDSTALGYKIERSLTELGPWTQIGISSTSTYADALASSDWNKTWYYRVRAYDGAGNDQEYSNIASCYLDMTPPTAPIDMTSSLVGALVRLDWADCTDVSGISGYTIERSAAGDGPWATARAAVESSYAETISQEDQGKVLYYRVNAVDGRGNISNPSVAEAVIVPDMIEPSAPSSLTVELSGPYASVSWTPSIDNMGVAGYKLDRREFGVSDWSPVGTSNEPRFDDLIAPIDQNKTLEYRVSAYDQAGNFSDPSSSLAVFVPDSTGPNKPGGVMVVPTLHDLYLDWDTSSDNVGVAGYSVERSSDGGAEWQEVATTTATGFADSDVLARTGDLYRVRALDYVGNPSPYSAAAGSPTGLVAINDGAGYARSTLSTLAVSATAVGAYGMDKMRFKNDGGAWSAWQPYAVARSWTLTFGDGAKKVWSQFKDEAGNESVPVFDTILLDMTKPTSTVSSPTFSTNAFKTATFKVSWSGSDSDSGITSYDVQYKVGSGGAWTAYKKATTATSAGFKGKAGKTYYFRVQARDKAGNTGAWSTAKKTIVPFDNNSLIAKRAGFANTLSKASSSFYLGTVRYSSAKGDAITYKFTGKSVSLITTKAKNRAKAKIYIDGKYKKTVDTYSAAIKYRRVVYSKDFTKSGTHTIKIVNVGNRKRLDVDALGVGR